MPCAGRCVLHCCALSGVHSPPCSGAFGASSGLSTLAGPGAGCSSLQHDVLVVPSSTGWCSMQAHPTPLCLSTSGTQTRRMTPVWSARPCPATSRVSIPWAWAHRAGGVTCSPALCPSCAPPLQAVTAGTVSPGCRQGVHNSTVASLMAGGPSAQGSAQTLGGTPSVLELLWSFILCLGPSNKTWSSVKCPLGAWLGAQVQWASTQRWRSIRGDLGEPGPAGPGDPDKTPVVPRGDR